MSEPDVSELPGVTEVVAIIDGEPVSLRAIDLPLQDALGYRLATDIVTDRDYPPFDKSLMDGYAVRSADLAAGMKTFEVIGEIAAGTWTAETVDTGQTMAIMTGAPMPDGADGVVPVEFLTQSSVSPAARGQTSSREGDPSLETVEFQPIDRPTRFVMKRGAELQKGQVVLKVGTKLGPAQIALAATVGAATVRVYAKPRVAVLGSGDELVPIDVAEPATGQIRNANNAMLIALLTKLSCTVTDLGVVRDDEPAVRQALSRASDFDVLFITGGMSMGRYDFVPRTLIELGAQMKVTKLRIKPGKPFVFAKLNDAFIFGLPGNPVSAFVCTLRLASRLLARLNGGDPEPAWRMARLTEPLPTNGPREFYQPAIFDGQSVHPLKWRGSADVYTLSQANALIVCEENAPAVPAGGIVRVLEIPL